MLEINSLFLNMASLSESNEKVQEFSKADLLLPIKEIKADENQFIDNNSFVLLMAQMLTTVPLDQPDIPLNKAFKETSITDIPFEKEENYKDAEEILENQSAMIWINSESYEPPKARPSEEIKITMGFKIEKQESIQNSEHKLISSLKAPLEPIVLKSEGQPIIENQSTMSKFPVQEMEKLSSEDLNPVKPEKAAQGLISNINSKEPVEVKPLTSQNVPKLKPEILKIADELPKAFDSQLKHEKMEAKEEIIQTRQIEAEEFIRQETALKPTLARTEKPNFSEQLVVANELPKLKEVINPSLNKESFTIASTAISQVANDLSVSEKTNMDSNNLDIQTPNVPNTLSKMEPQQVIKPQDFIVNLTKPQWENQLSENIVWCKEQGVQNVHLKIHPEELGPIEISVKVVDNLASVSIASHSSQVREMMDEALPRLRELMTAQGLNLSEVSIESEGKSNQRSHERTHAEQQRVFIEEEKVSTSSKTKSVKGLVDYFA